MRTPPPERRWDRGARLHLILMVALLLYAAGMTAYRFTLPTDGWLAAQPDEIDAFGYEYEKNVMGLPSPLQPGDYVAAINGIELAGAELSALWTERPAWQAGNVVRYTVERGEEVLEIDVPLTHWDIGRYMTGGGLTLASLFGYFGILVFLATGFLAFWRKPENPSARAFWVLAAITAALFLTLDLLPAMAPDAVDPLATILTAAIIFGAFSVLWPPAFIRFALVFPRPKPILARRPWIAYLPYGVGLLVMIAFARGIIVAGFIWTASSVLIALALLIHNALTMRDATSRAQLRWGLGSMILGIGIFFLTTFLPTYVDLPQSVEQFLLGTGWLSFVIMGLGLAVAVTRYRLFDIDVIIRRTTSYAVLTALLALVYFGSVVVLQRLLSPLTGESNVAVVLSTLLIAALFLPLRRRVQGAIDRRFFRRKYDAERVLARFAATARDETDLDTLTAELVQVIQETMQPESVSVWLQPAGSSRKPADDR